MKPCHPENAEPTKTEKCRNYKNSIDRKRNDVII